MNAAATKHDTSMYPSIDERGIKPRAPSGNPSRSSSNQRRRLVPKFTVNDNAPSQNVAYQGTTSGQRSLQDERKKKTVLSPINRDPIETNAVRRNGSQNVSFQGTTSGQRSSQDERKQKTVLPPINKDPRETDALRRNGILEIAGERAYRRFYKKLATASAMGGVGSTAQRTQMIKLEELPAEDHPQLLSPRRNRNRNRSVGFEEHPDKARSVNLGTVQEAADTGNRAPSQSKKSKILEQEPFEDFVANITPLIGPYRMNVTKEHLKALDTYIFAIDNERNTVTDNYRVKQWSTLLEALDRMPTIDHYEDLIRARRQQLETIHSAWEEMVGFKYKEEFHPDRPYSQKNSVKYMRNMIKRYRESGKPFTPYQIEQLWQQRTKRRLPSITKGVLNGQPAEVILREAMGKPEWNKEKTK